jgi:hypothetical protein
VLALACQGVSTALSAQYKSGLKARREQHELILLHPHPTVPSYAATNPLTQRLCARTLFAGVSLSLQLLPSFLVIRLDTLLTIRVSSARMYRLLQVLRFVSVLTAS